MSDDERRSQTNPEGPDHDPHGPSDGQGEELVGAEVHTALISGATFTDQPVQYSVVDGVAVFEGDIILGLDADLQLQAGQIRSEAAQLAQGVGDEVAPGEAVDAAKPPGGLPESAVIVPGQNKRWPGGVVPFVLDNTLTPAARTAITGAIDHWHLNTRLHLRPRTGTDAQWVVFRDSNQCSSWVGRLGGAQDINIAAGCGRGATIHEIGHAVGLWHEQSREDRDKFITILWQNIQAGQGHNFDQHISDGDDIGEYDFGSIMHYGPTAFGTTDPATGRTNTTISPNQALPPGVIMGQRNGLSQSDRGAVAWMYGSIYPSPSNTWLGRFQGQPGTELLHYSPARHHWYLGQTVNGAMDFRDVGDTTGFGDLDDGRPFWTGDFTGDGRTDVLFYYPGDDNWWLGTLQNGQLTWSLVGNTAGFGHAINNAFLFWAGDFTGDGRTEVLFTYPGDGNWWLGTVQNGQLTWSLIGNTAGFGGFNDGRPVWTGDFNGDGHTDVLFYYPGDHNWWLGTVQNGQLTWSLIGNTAGFGGFNDGRPVWTGDFNGDGHTDVLFYYPGDDNWWLGTLQNGQLVWTFAGNTAGFGHGINDGRPFWTGDFNGDGRTDVLFYYPGNDNWWLGTLQNVPGENAQCAPLRSRISSQESEIRQLQQLKNGLDPRDPGDRQEIREINRQITALRQQITQEQQEMAGLSCPAVPNPGGLQLTWTLVGNTIGFGHAINDGRAFWTGDFNGDGHTDVLFHYRGDLNWWRGSIVGDALNWTKAGNW